MNAGTGLELELNAELPTWFKVGGRAERLCRPGSVDELRRALELDPALRVLGDGANLLVDDTGVAELVAAMETRTGDGLGRVEIDDVTGIVRAGAGAGFPKLIRETVAKGLGGLEGLGGIPATVGGATVMNAGGTFGQIADSISRVFALDRRGRDVELARADIAFGYRRSGLQPLIVTEVELKLQPVGQAEQPGLRQKLKDVMAYKAESQPMSASSAGCCFKNPTLVRELKFPDVPPLAPGVRASAGMLIDRAGCKGLRVGGAEVSQRHGNFLVTHDGATARDVIELMREVERRVLEAFGVRLEREVVVWSRDPEV